MEREDKERLVERHLRMTARFETRKENEAKKKQRGPRPRRDRREDDEWDEDLDPPGRSRRGERSPDLPRDLDPGDCPARVLSVFGARLLVDEQGEALRVDAPRGVTLAAGDRVALVRRADRVQVAGVAARAGELVRPDATGRGRRQVLAANVDLGLVVLPPRRISAAFALRVRLALRAGGVETGVLVHQADRLDEHARRAARNELEPLADEGVPWIFTSVVSGEGLEELRRWTAQRTTVLVGQSGAGKSSLTNALCPDADQTVRSVRGDDQRGRHTTTAARLVALAGAGWLVDTPGVRSYLVAESDPRVLLEGLSALAPLAQHCPRGCRHLDAPDCAVARAAAGDPALQRHWRLFLGLCRQEDRPA